MGKMDKWPHGRTIAGLWLQAINYPNEIVSGGPNPRTWFLVSGTPASEPPKVYWTFHDYRPTSNVESHWRVEI